MTARLRRTVATTALAAMLVSSLSAAQGSPDGGAGPTTSDEMLRYVTAHRDQSALVAYSVTPDGLADPRDEVLAVNASRPMPLGSTVKIITLAVYAREVAAGRLDPRERVALAAWDRYYLPLRDGLAHPAALDALGVPMDEFGFALDGGTTASLDEVVFAAIRHSDNAAADYLLDRIGRPAFVELIARAGLGQQDVPQSILGLFLSWANHDAPQVTWRRVWALASMGAARYRAYVSALACNYGEALWRQAELAWIATMPTLAYAPHAAAAEALFPRGSAADYARIMAGVVAGTFISREVSAIMRRHLEWPMAYPELSDGFAVFGNKGGTLPGVTTDANYFVAAGGDYAGRPRVAVLFLSRLDEATLAALGRTAAQNAFNRRLAVDRAFVRRVGRALDSTAKPE
ncbi:MAG: serine hydrolase [Vicinamibacterales bacterium]